MKEFREQIIAFKSAPILEAIIRLVSFQSSSYGKEAKYFMLVDVSLFQIQSTLVISNSLISKWKSGPSFNTEIYQQATKYCGKEENCS